MSCNGDCSNCKMCMTPTHLGLSNEVEGKNLPIIDGGFLIVTEKCSLACTYCFVNQHARDMTLEVALDAIDYLYMNQENHNRALSINFFGGEPLLRWDDICVPCIEYAKKKKYNVRWGITTNGVALTEERLKYMKEHNVGLLFSIDGAERTQDLNRPFHSGKGSSTHVNTKIPMVLKYYPNATFRSTIAHDTVQYTYENMMYAIEKGYKDLFNIPNVFADWTEEQVKILKEQMRMFSDYYINEFKQNRLPITYKPYERMFPVLLEINYNDRTGRHRPYKKFEQRGLSKCGIGGSRFISIGVDGELYTCQELVTDHSPNNKFHIGNIYDGIDEEKRLALVNSFEKAKVKGIGMNCNECRYNNVCDGGCVANNYIANNDVNVMCKMYCIWQQILIDECEYICKELGESKNELFKQKFFVKGGGRNGKKNN